MRGLPTITEPAGPASCTRAAWSIATFRRDWAAAANGAAAMARARMARIAVGPYRVMGRLLSAGARQRPGTVPRNPQESLKRRRIDPPGMLTYRPPSQRNSDDRSKWA